MERYADRCLVLSYYCQTKIKKKLNNHKGIFELLKKRHALFMLFVLLFTYNGVQDDSHIMWY